MRPAQLSYVSADTEASVISSGVLVEVDCGQQRFVTAWYVVKQQLQCAGQANMHQMADMSLTTTLRQTAEMQQHWILLDTDCRDAAALNNSGDRL